jgi:hypothetical protein
MRKLREGGHTPVANSRPEDPPEEEIDGKKVVGRGLEPSKPAVAVAGRDSSRTAVPCAGLEALNGDVSGRAPETCAFVTRTGLDGCRFVAGTGLETAIFAVPVMEQVAGGFAVAAAGLESGKVAVAGSFAVAARGLELARFAVALAGWDACSLAVASKARESLRLGVAPGLALSGYPFESGSGSERYKC